MAAATPESAAAGDAPPPHAGDASNGGTTSGGDGAGPGPESSTLSLPEGGHRQPKFVIEADIGSLTSHVRRSQPAGKAHSAVAFTKRFGNLTLKPRASSPSAPPRAQSALPRGQPAWNEAYWKAAQLTQGRDDDVFFGPSVWLRESAPPAAAGHDAPPPPLGREASSSLRPEASARSGRSLRAVGARPVSHPRVSSAPAGARPSDGGDGASDLVSACLWSACGPESGEGVHDLDRAWIFFPLILAPAFAPESPACDGREQRGRGTRFG